MLRARSRVVATSVLEPLAVPEFSHDIHGDKPYADNVSAGRSTQETVATKQATFCGCEGIRPGEECVMRVQLEVGNARKGVAKRITPCLHTEQISLWLLRNDRRSGPNADAGTPSSSFRYQIALWM